MVGTSKILTVSYGTFSCTLEGFEEPFSTMRAIAEYFRDLAADDRYFGAEPPTPDAEMLHRIAEREIQRRVEAKINASGVVLRASDTSDMATAAPTAPAAAPADPALHNSHADIAAATETGHEPAAEPAPQPPLTTPDADSAAAKLMRIRAVVAERSAALAGNTLSAAEFADADLVAGTDAYDDLSEDDFGFDLDLPEPPPVAGRAADAAPTATATEDTAASDALAVDRDEDILVDVAETDPLPPAMPDPAPAQVADTAPVADSLIPAEAADTALNRIFAAESDIGGANTDAEDYDADEDTDQPGPTISPDETDAAPSSDDGLSFVQRARARVIKIRKYTNAPQPVFPSAPPTVAAPDPSPDDATETAAAADEPHDQHGAQTDVGAKTDIVAKSTALAPVDAPVDASAGIPETANDADAAMLAEISATLGDTGLDAEQEKDLMRQLAEASRSDDGREGHERRAILAGSPQDDEAAVARLMEEAKSQLEGDENRRRFNAISHLKAAVAATVADRKMKTETPAPSQVRTAREMDRYREDLSKVVRPHRSEQDDSADDRRSVSGDRAAPLVLVSEQRIGSEKVPPAGEIGPIRASRHSLTETDDDEIDAMIAAMPSPESAKSFAEYAERMGATGLSDLLEVAAAYTATVEGLPHFSRPQILLKVAHVADDATYSREDGLRTFGMLLREGKIEKLRRGQFKITDASKYMAEARRTAT